MAYGTRVRFEELRRVGFAGIGAGYAALGGATSDHTRLVSIFNGTDADVDIALNDFTTVFSLAASSGQIFDFTSNKVRDDGLFLMQGTIFYQKRTSAAPTKGNLWIQVMYADGGV